MADIELIAATLAAALLQARIAAGGAHQAIAGRSGGPDEHAVVELYLKVLAELKAQMSSSP